MSVDKDVFDRLKNVIEQTIPLKGKEVALEASFIDDMGAESMDIVCLVMGLEDEFGGEIPQEDIQKLRTVKDAMDYIASKLYESKNNSAHPELAEAV